jgi:hypothetical protein
MRSPPLSHNYCCLELPGQTPEIPSPGTNRKYLKVMTFGVAAWLPINASVDTLGYAATEKASRVQNEDG